MPQAPASPGSLPGWGSPVAGPASGAQPRASSAGSARSLGLAPVSRFAVRIPSISSANSDRFAVGIDLGTSGLKVALCRADGGIVSRATRAIETRLVAGGGAEQDADEIWTKTRAAVREAVRAAEVEPAAIVAVRCVSQYSSVLPVDPKCTPIGPLITWMDVRGAEHNMAIYARHPEAFETWLEVHGIIPLPSGNDSLAHMLHVKMSSPDTYDKAAAFLEPMDFLNGKLTGRLAANVCSAFMFLLTDNRDLTSLEYHPDLLAMAGIEPTKLPELIPLGSPVARLLPEVSEDLGLSADTMVYPGFNDTQAGALAAGVVDCEHGALDIGTTSVLIARMDRKDTDAENQIVSMPSPIEGRYLVMAENGLGGKTLEHFLRNVVHTRDALGDHRVEDLFHGVEAVMGETNPGAGGVVFLPWLNGSFAPRDNPRMRGGFLNVSLETQRAQLLRAVLEGVGYSVRWLFEPVESFCGHDIDHLVFGGGAAASDSWSQILADILGRPVHQLEDAGFANCRAAALLALSDAGVVSRDDLNALVAVRAVYQPNLSNQSLYDELFNQFVASYERTQPLFEALNP
ncbi:MAG: carbohydrate kinase [Acidobacteria bacterium]|nr:MAG: carbohydrate kinase [Acidobacteriota bacterium]